MKQYPLEHPFFDGYINNSCIHRRSALRQLAERMEAFPHCPSNILFRKIRTFLWGAVICSMCIVSTFSIASIWESARTRKIVMQEVYTASERKAQEAKMGIKEGDGARERVREEVK